MIFPRITIPAQVPADLAETNPGAVDFVRNQNFGSAAFLDAGTGTGKVPIIPVPMSQLSDGVKGTMDQIRAHTDSAAYHAASDFATPDSVASAISVLTNGTPEQLNTFLEIYNRFLSDESAAASINSALSSEAATRATSDTTLSAAISGETTARTAADATLSTNLSSETINRTNADSINSTAITTEATARASAISAEAATRAAADTVNANAIIAEASARTAAITTAINNLVNGAGPTMDTLGELATALANDESAASALSAMVAAITPHKETAILDFGFPDGNEGDLATTTVSASWVTATSRITCLSSPSASADHSTDETVAEDIRFSAVNIIAGVSFDVQGYAPQGTWGRHNCSVISN